MKRFLTAVAAFLALATGAHGQATSIQNLPAITVPSDSDLFIVEHIAGLPGQKTNAISAGNLAQYLQGKIGLSQGFVATLNGRAGNVTLSLSDIPAAAPLASPVFTGTPAVPTASAADNSTTIANTAFVKSQGYITASGAPVQSVAGRTGSVVLSVGDVAGAAPLASPALTGVPTAPTAALSDNSSAIATTAFVKGSAGALRSYIAGAILSNDATTPNTVLDIAAGAATADDGSALMTLSGALTKSIGATWVVGSGNSALDTGSVAANTWYHVFLIQRPDTGVVDVLLSTSATAPTLPGSYTRKRRIGAIRTNPSSQIMAFVQTGDRFDWVLPQAEYSGTPGTTSATTLTLAYAPPGVAVEGILAGYLYDGSASGSFLYLSALAAGDVATGGAAASGVSGNTGVGTFFRTSLFTNAAAQVRRRVSSTTLQTTISTYAWVDSRGRNQ